MVTAAFLVAVFLVGIIAFLVAVVGIFWRLVTDHNQAAQYRQIVKLYEEQKAQGALPGSNKGYKVIYKKGGKVVVLHIPVEDDAAAITYLLKHHPEVPLRAITLMEKE